MGRHEDARRCLPIPGRLVKPVKATVEKMTRPVIWGGEQMWWTFRVPGPTMLVGWRATQREAFRACCEILRYRHERTTKQ